MAVEIKIFIFFALFAIGVWADSRPFDARFQISPPVITSMIQEAETTRLLNRQERGDSYNAYKAGLIGAACRFGMNYGKNNLYIISTV